MKKFLFETLSFAFLLFIILSLIKETVPFYWGAPTMRKKIEYVLSNADKFDAFFIGSSHTYNHINPILFDKHTGQNSFNLGNHAMFFAEVNYILENLLKVYPANHPVDFYVEGLAPKVISNSNLHTVRSKYFMDWKRFKIGFNHFSNKKLYPQIYKYTISFLENQMCIGELFPIIKYHTREKRPIGKMEIKQKGFFPVDQQFKLFGRKDLEARRNRFLKSKKVNRTKKSKFKMRTLSEKMLNLPPQNSNISFYQFLGNNITELDLHFDSGHFNTKGANKFTRGLAKCRNLY
jgi:hypothetical protein